MIPHARLLAALAVLPLASGCVAAAIPVLAGGAMAKTMVDGNGDEGAREAAPPPASADAATPSSAPRPMMRAPTRANPEPAPIGSLPARLATGSGAPFAAFADYARAEARAYLPDETRRSVMLSDPGSLKPETRACADQPPAVLIDLDPAGATFDPASAGTIAGDLAPSLMNLRARGLAIVWLSAAPLERAGDIRALFTRAGLDPIGRDRIALPAAGESKQELRKRIGEEYCIEAIAGDRRADFDELYDYLRDESAAAPLEALIGNGWFLVPPPVSRGE